MKPWVGVWRSGAKAERGDCVFAAPMGTVAHGVEHDTRDGEHAAEGPGCGKRYGSSVTPCGCAVGELDGVGEERRRADEHVDDEPTGGVRIRQRLKKPPGRMAHSQSHPILAVWGAELSSPVGKSNPVMCLEYPSPASRAPSIKPPLVNDVSVEMSSSLPLH